MKKLLLIVLLLTFGLTLGFIQYFIVDLDPGYISTFGYGSLCVSDKGYPAKDKYDASQFDFKNGKFYIDGKKYALNVRAILPEGKTYRMLLNEFVAKRPDYADDDAEEKMIWRVFVSHNKKGEKNYSSFPLSNSEIVNELSYATSEKELAFIPLNLQLWEEHADWNSSGIKHSDFQSLVDDWMFDAKPGWQMYIVHTVGYYERHRGNDRCFVEDPIMTALVEMK
ncbi:MAG: hypothetical protein EHM58_12515 [Ignavibacteriae bacterium]|nr:MAG: hypothetical protein EHM58_12515 [Ignavibacteriota bacterium]